MEYQLENPVRVSTKSPHASLYAWLIEELDSATKNVSPNYVPWGWNLYFDATDLMVVRSLEFEGDKASHVGEHIHGRLFPQTSDRRAAATYSFFGTNRKIESFTLRIVKSKDDKESFHVFGSVSYEHEWDFEQLLQGDSVEVEIVLPADRFDRLASFIEDGRSMGIATLGAVEGFYSEWSPSIRTKDIKILANLKDQNVKTDGAADIAPPALGKLGSFSFRLLKGDSATAKIEATDVDTASPSIFEERPAATPSVDMTGLEKKLSKLTVPLWIAVGLLFVSLFVR
ncbi:MULTISPECIES: hypothetical protein [Sinorhizobium]|uniref:hypothetical protein n=1 Tax=Sinorhizobium TaxID=28105 RepID=UPI0011AAEA86|nr:MULTISPECIES: hypothetical protein [Sinorhizobium]MDW9439225.1 hypothetical protein [Sinorhizobium meliloti]MDW9484048.1 hypothetical protein [Sinorhizobium meliloti]MDX0525158.1 hypothetical protein [Sinorhizobium medicae]MDX0636678.1 hypothetical protein [Sinorhizobium medicae]MQV61364.1 hypothetical protein [Sinorhizobium meliloti]